ncbi:MAG: NAD(P)(+) transhydrogenase (Re/Si-specific) subunit beta [Acidimicrobiales bacterium]
MTDFSYLLAGVMFIVGLKRLGSPRTARSGNLVASVGMALALVVTLVDQDITAWGTVIAGIIVGTVIGAVLALRVQMTGMPELVAAFNGFGGIASALVAAAELRRVGGADLPVDTAIAVAVSIVVGAVTFTGSFVAFAKLRGLVSGRPVTYRSQQIVNGTLFGVLVGVIVWATATDEPAAFWLAGALALVIGVLGVIPIGGADMPVVISLLNSYSGLAAAAAGFVIANNALIIGGALVGSAGFILTSLMTKAMNRSLANVLFAGFGTADSTGTGTLDRDDRQVKAATADDVAIALGYAESVVMVPGYGLAVAQAQHVTHRLASELAERGVRVRYAIHPVAGRMPGHMNVLLAEADVSYELMADLDEINSEFARTDVVLVLGANDVVNPSARDDPSSPIHGMPVLDVDHARTVVVVKRSLSPGFAGIDNPLFYMDGTLMYFDDARKALDDVLAALDEI